MKKYLSIDVGASSIKYGVVQNGTELSKVGSVKTPRDSMESLLDAFRRIYAEVGEGVSGVGVSFTATLNYEKGYCFDSGFLTYTVGKELIPIFQEVFPVPVTVENDGNCGALAESRFGSLKDVKDAIVLILGTEIGGGIIKDHKIHRGKKSCSGEFSYMIVNYDTFEKWADYNGSRGYTEPFKKATGLEEADGKIFFEAANAGDADALRILDRFTRFLCVQIYNLQCSYAPERFAIGGGISRQPLLMEYLQKNMDDLYENRFNTLPRAEVVVCEFMDEANLIGAVCHLKDCLGEN